MPLTPKQQRFVEEYLVDLNAAAAARRAGYSGRRASEIGYQLLRKTTVQAAIQAAIEARSRRTEVTADSVVKELALVAFQRAGNLFRPDGSLKDPAEWNDVVSGSLASVEVFEEFAGFGEDRKLVGCTKKVKLWDKVKALELLGRHLGLFPNKLDVTSGGRPLVEAMTDADLERRIADLEAREVAAARRERTPSPN